MILPFDLIMLSFKVYKIFDNMITLFNFAYLLFIVIYFDVC